MARKQGRSDVDDFVTILTVELEYNRKDVERVVRAFLNLLVNRLGHGKSVQFRKFGKIQVVKRQRTRRWDFKQQKVIDTGTWYGVKYEPSENIKKALKKLQEDT